MQENVLFICGTLHQTTMMHQIARQLDSFNCYFTPYYLGGVLEQSGQKGWLDFSAVGGRHCQATKSYLLREKLPLDVGGRRHNYAAVVTCSDLVIQRNICGKRIVLVQEGLTEPEGLAYQLVRWMKLPRYLANTAAFGLSDAYDVFCVAFHGYRDLFLRKGIDPGKVVVTGIPNFDNVASFCQNDFPHRNYVLAATSNGRETFKQVDRIAFICYAHKLADGRQLIFKLHPNEDLARAQEEIAPYAPDALVYEDGDIRPMIANADILVCEYSTVILYGLAMGKRIYSPYFDLEAMRPLVLIQNGGSSAVRIAEIIRQLVAAPLSERQRVAQRFQGRLRWGLP
jgi:hypothetical protein